MYTRENEERRERRQLLLSRDEINLINMWAIAHHLIALCTVWLNVQTNNKKISKK